MDPAKGIGVVRMVAGLVGIFLAIFYLPDTEASLWIIAALMVGVVGVLSFVSHVIFYKADAARLGWSAENPGWQFEVGFANLAFGLAAFLAVAGHWGVESLSLVTLGYAIYLLQAAVLHAYRYYHEKKPLGYFVRSSLLTLVYVSAMSAFAVMAMMDKQIWPF